MTTAERETLEKMVHGYRPRLVAYVRHFVDNSSDAEDMVQDSFFKYFKNYSGSSASDFPRIIFTIVRNKCLDYLKHRKVVMGVIVQQNDCPGEELYNLDFLGPEADVDYLYSELKRQIDSVISSLPPRCREVFCMSRFQHKSNPEISETLGISVSTVEKHIIKALDAIRRSLDDSGDDGTLQFLFFLLFMNL